MDNNKHSTRIALVSAAISFFLSAIFAAYIVGQRTGKILQIEAWQKETAPRIERMDREGTVSFGFFKSTYEDEQSKQYKRLEELEKQSRHIETMELRIDRLERNHNAKPTP